MQLLISTKKDGRTISNLIKALLKSKTCKQIKRLQYIKDYVLDENNNIIKSEEKVLIIILEENQKTKTIWLMNKFLNSDYQILS